MPETRVPALQVCCPAKADVLAIGSRSNAMKKGHSLLNRRSLKLLVPSRFRQQIFPVEDGGVRPHRMGDFLRELGPGFEGVPVSGDERAVMTLHMRERPEAIHLGLEEPVRVVEGLRDAEEPHGFDRLHGRTVAILADG
jgi:hypothetical protein